jgi:hypothetical protein
VQTSNGDVQRESKFANYQERCIDAMTHSGNVRYLHQSLAVCMVVAMPPNLCARNRPGPKPIFTERVVVKLRQDQRQSVERIAHVLGLSTSEIVRWFIDEGVSRQSLSSTD